MKKQLYIIILLITVAVLGFTAGKLTESPMVISKTSISRNVDHERESILTRAVGKVSEAVVCIETEYKPEERRGAFEDFFREFFGEESQGERISRGAGSGALISEKGLILTAGHVVDNAITIHVILPGGGRKEARLLGKDTANDIALLKVDGKDLPFLEVGDSDTLIPGEWMIALGNPFGLMANDTQPTVTVGVVSAVMRSITMNESPELRTYHGLIQTDAAINPGNSGGPLVDAHGKLMGINTAIFSTSGGSQGIGFAIPANTAKKSIASILKFGDVRRGWTGLVTADIGPDVRDKYGIEYSGGVIVKKIYPGSPGSVLRTGQIILEINGRSVKNVRWWNGYMSSLLAEDKINLKLWDQGEHFEKEIVAEDFNTDTILKLMGVKSVKELTYDMAKSHNLKREKGLIVVKTDDGGVVERFDVLRAINRKRIFTQEDLDTSLKNITPGNSLMILLERRGYYMNKEVEL